MAWAEKDHNDHSVSAVCRVTNHQTRLPRATSSLALNACRDGASTTSESAEHALLQGGCRGHTKNLSYMCEKVLSRAGVCWAVYHSSAEKAPGRPRCGLPVLQGSYKQEGEWLFMRVDGDRTRGNSFKLRHGRFRLDMRRKFFPQMVVTH